MNTAQILALSVFLAMVMPLIILAAIEIVLIFLVVLIMFTRIEED